METVLIKVIAGSSHPELAQAVCDTLGLKLHPTEVRHFSDEEIDVLVKETCVDSDVFILQSLAQKPSEYMVELFLLADAAKRQGAKSLNAIIPYLAYMRQDKMVDEHAYSGQVIAQLLSHVFDSVILVEPHVPQVGGFFSVPVYEIDTASLIAKDLQSKELLLVTMVSPDAGGVKRVEMSKPNAESPVAIIQKTRTENNDVVVGGLLGDVAGRDCIIVDDVLGTGSTLVQAAQLLKQNGALSVRAYVTHLMMSAGASIIEDSAIDELISFDTIPHKDNKYVKLSVRSEIAAIITRLIGEEHDFKRTETR